MKNRLHLILAMLALIAALGASVYLVFAPLYTGISINPDTGGQVQATKTLLEVNGTDVLIPLAIPPALTTAGLLSVLLAVRGRRLLVWVIAFLLAGFVLITGFSIGMFYVPAMILMMTCAIVTQIEARQSKAG